MTSKLDGALRNALSGMTGEPAQLFRAIKFYLTHDRISETKIESELIKRVLAGPNDETRRLLHQYIGQWDWEPDAPWTDRTPPNTERRRKAIYALIGASKRLQAVIDQHIPYYTGATPVIIDDPTSAQEWYTFDFRRQHSFYWREYEKFLVNRRKLDREVVNLIGDAANGIVKRLANPASDVVFQARGLVVGYVQSGKTTNFTAVVAKAIDAGYRLIIVLSGTTNLLRNQTQRRLDMDLVGVENILRGGDDSQLEHDYTDDVAWPSGFISYGLQPSKLGNIDIHRLTTQEDFTSTDGGLNPLEFDFEKIERAKPLYHSANLAHAGARLAIVKKEQSRLKKLVKALKAVGRQKCAEVPTLIIDDESDQASVNTVDPDKNAGKRSRINERIVEILDLLPRAQYIGYTATPFANVFINPKDAKDLYPRHFIVSLDRPAGYMGATEFLDMAPVKTGQLSNQRAYVRDVPRAGQPSDQRLLEAIDAFVLTGAIKKFRQTRGGYAFKHHTMLYHHSVKKDDHQAAAARLRRLWNSAGYASPSAAQARLEALLENDYRPVWLDRGRQLGLRFPRAYAELVPCLGEALDDIRRGKSPVLMVNSAEGADVPDFDGPSGVWKIIVGGAKLSRGYTIEGLTVSYFRRRTGMQDTLMQMGRWFGYRDGYSDLVRLYIGRQEPFGRRRIDLYDAFEAMSRDEEDFRVQLEMYKGEGGITPSEVPALVYNSHPLLRPTAKNKMFKARMTWAAFQYREPTSPSATKAGRRHNAALFERLFQKVRFKDSVVQAKRPGANEFSIKWATVGYNEIINVLSDLKWGKKKNPIDAEIAFLNRDTKPVDSWVIVAPQVEHSAAGTWTAGKETFNCVGRALLGERVKVFSSPEHVSYAKWLVGEPDADFKCDLAPHPRTGILLFYPTRERVEGNQIASGPPLTGFAIVLPKDSLRGQRIAWRA